jgi:hypothetical protein
LRFERPPIASLFGLRKEEEFANVDHHGSGERW